MIDENIVILLFRKIRFKNRIFFSINLHWSDICIRFAMGLTKKELQDIKESFGATRRTSIHSKKDLRHNLNLQRNIIKMFSGIDDNTR